MRRSSQCNCKQVSSKLGGSGGGDNRFGQGGGKSKMDKGSMLLLKR